MSAVVTLQDNLDMLPPMSNRIEAGNGSYYRDPEGTWRYVLNDLPVPGALDVLRHPGGDVVSMIAPELAPDLLLDTKGIAARWGITADAVYRYLYDRRIPGPQIRIGHCNAWTVPIVDMARARMPGHAWRRGRGRQ